MSNNVYILGGSQTDFSRNWAREGLEVYDMFAEALTDGIRDAGIEPAQIEVGHVGNFVADLFAGQGL
ncbi:MAG: thiolase domain-containing protein, partial [Pseudomonadota bacterium]|nr:thiolase domain-containing protein [Pseudomonadota bacterium]